LRAFPNHHRALYLIGEYQLRTKRSPPPNANYSAECYFERAIAFRPADGAVRMIYGGFLHRKGDLQAALAQYRAALARLPDFPELHYNLGLLLVDLKDYEGAWEHAAIAYRGGYPLPGLRNKLQAAGHWRTAATPSPTSIETDTPH
jgi:tetratricopeptide (TPR) repeat protein